MHIRIRQRGWWAVCLTLALLALSAPALMAQETTGAIEGVVKDPGGAVLPGATVELTGPPGKVVVVTDERGEYRFPRLPSGRYTVAASLAGFVTQTANIDLTVGITNRTEFTLGLAGVEETVSVSAQSLAIDTKSSSTATNISRERIEVLPRGRDFTDVVSQAAGAANESQAGGISIDGSSGSENRFVIDGIDTTSPQVGTNSVPLRAEFIEEVQVKSAGYAAEYGGSTGGVINAITKSGTNTFRGGVLADWEERSWGGPDRKLLVDSLTEDTYEYIDYEPGDEYTPKDEETRIDPGFYLGGPIFRDRLWFFGSYQPGIRSTERTVTFQTGVTNTFEQDFQVNYATWNVTGNIASKVLFRVGGNYSPYETEKTLPGKSGRTTLDTPDKYLRGFKGQRDTYSGSVDYLPTSNFVVSARLGRFHTDGESTGITFPGLIYNFSTASTPAGIAALPPEFRQPAGFTSDILVTDAQARDEYVRTYIGADATWYFSAGGQHQLKFGYQTEDIFNDVKTGYNADRILYYAGRTYTNTSGVPVPGTYGYFRLLNISTLGETSSRNNALFVQDTWQIGPKLTLNLGLRSEQEKIPNFGDAGPQTAIEFPWSEKLAPRLGFTYDPLGDAKWKIYGSWGLYYDVMKYELPRGSFGGDRWVDYYYTWNNPNYAVNASGCETNTNTILERPTCAGGTFIEAVDRRFNSAAAPPEEQTVDPNLKPMKNQELQLGLSHELTPQMVVGARYIWKDLLRAIEDVGVLVPGVGEVFYIANPGEGVAEFILADECPTCPAVPKAKRDYKGLELTFQKRYSDNWALYLSYTISRLYGNYSGLASSDEDGRTSPNVNRFFDALQMTFDRNAELVYGRLGTDRPNQFKGQFIYGFPWNMTLGLNQYIGQGIPISEQAYVATVPFFPYGRNSLGRTDMLTATDLSVFQDFKLGGRFDVQVGVTILNLFDQDTVTRRYDGRMVGDLPLNSEEFFNQPWDYEALLREDPTLLDVKFNQPDQFQAPRAIRLTAKFTF